MPLDPIKKSEDSNAPKVTQTKAGVRKVKEEDELFDDSAPSPKKKKKSTGKGNKIVIGCVLVALVAVIAVFAIYSGGDSEKGKGSGEVPVVEGSSLENGDPAEVEGSEARPWLNPSTETAAEGEVTGEEPKVPATPPAKAGEVDVGIRDISENTVSKNTAPMEPDKFVKDLKANKIPEGYEIRRIYSEVDFISYKKHRTSTAPGIELYWLEAKYKGKPARVQVPFTIFKELDEVGVTVVDVEVVEIEYEQGTTHQVVTGFSVRPDYKKILEENR